MDRKGTLYFFTGLAGAGKTTIGGLFYERLKQYRPDAVLADGDKRRARVKKRVLETGREMPPDDVFYSTEMRKRGAMLTTQRCEKIILSGRDVVLCSIAMYREVREWYRTNLENYREIYIKVKWETLYARNQKGLYSPGQKNVVGVDLPWDEPDTPDVVIQNDGEETPEQIVDRLWKQLGMDALAQEMTE